MKAARRFTIAALATVSALGLTGCSVDTLIWGGDGAEVIAATDQFVQDLASDGTSDLLCDDADAALGAAGDWDDLSAGEPERFVAEFWEAQVALDPQWSINLEGLPDDVAPGDEFPGDVFYREIDDELCVIDVVWVTLVDAR